MPSIEKYRKADKRPGPIRTETTESEKRRQKFYKSKAWQQHRQNILFQTPYCEAHAAVTTPHVTKNLHVDHIISWDAKGGATLSEENLMILCRSCHATKTMWERSGYLVVQSTGVDGDRMPALGEKERVVTKLSSIL